MQTLPRVEITQNLGLLAVRSERAVLKAAQDTVDLKMNNKQMFVEMDIELPRVEIDQTGCFDSAGLKTCIKQYMDFVGKCRQESIGVIGKIASEGREFIEIQRSDAVIQEQSRRIWQKDASVTVKAMPGVRPEITGVLGRIEFNVQPGDPGIRWDRSEDEGTYVPARTEISWRERPNIDISVAGGINALV